MHTEIAQASAFIASLFSPPLSSATLDAFQSTFEIFLDNRFQGHWYPNDPERGSAYRSILHHAHVGGEGTSVALVSACVQAQVFEKKSRHGPLPSPVLHRLQRPFTLWIDPGCVAVRYGPGPGCSFLAQQAHHNARHTAVQILWGTPSSHGPNKSSLWKARSPNSDLSPRSIAAAIWSSPSTSIADESDWSLSSLDHSMVSSSNVSVPSSDAAHDDSVFNSFASSDDDFCVGKDRGVARELVYAAPHTDLVARSTSSIFQAGVRSHQYHSSISSIDSLASSMTHGSSAPSTTGSMSPAYHSAHSSPLPEAVVSNLVVSSKTTFHSHDNGNVGVLGGGVLLGRPSVPAAASSRAEASCTPSSTGDMYKPVSYACAARSPASSSDVDVESCASGDVIVNDDGTMEDRKRTRGRRSRGRGSGRTARRLALATAYASFEAQEQLASVDPAIVSALANLLAQREEVQRVMDSFAVASAHFSL